ncbi:PqiC family protein [Skermanella stibiiresistens]|nr:PqiC family protein [Skermanella stibiiresistens]
MTKLSTVPLARPLASLFALLLVAGCAGSQPSRLYTLTAAPPRPPAVATKPSRVIGLESVGVPDYLRRPEIVTRTSANQLKALEFDRWGGTLELMINQTLLRNLNATMPGAEVLQMPVRMDLSPTNTVEIDLDRFEAEEAGQAVLEARWRIYTGDRRPLRFGRTAVAKPVSTPLDPDQVAAALSLALADLATDIAGALQK